MVLSWLPWLHKPFLQLVFSLMLKDASEIIWVHSPTGSDSSPIPFLKCTHNDSNEDEVTVKKKTCVSTKH